MAKRRNQKEQRLARERAKEKGIPYTRALAEVRAEHAESQRTNGGNGGADR